MSWWLTKVKERNENIINAQNTVANIKGSKIVSTYEMEQEMVDHECKSIHH